MSTDLTLHSDDHSRRRLAGSGLRFPATIENAGPHARSKFFEFFYSQIANANTRKAYGRAVVRFFEWCQAHDLQLEEVHPNLASMYIRSHPASDATVKQHLAALRRLYDWFVTEQVVSRNPFTSVRGPKLVRTEGETPALTPEEVRRLFTMLEEEASLVALRDRALIGTMLYTFGRVGAVVNMRVKDYAPAGGRKMTLHLREKGGKRHRVPAHHRLQEYLDAYIEAAGIADDKDGWLFQSVNRSKELTGKQLNRRKAWKMVKRRARQAGIAKDISPHSMRATGITAFLENGGELEAAQRIAAHADARTTKLYDRRNQRIDQGEIERIRFD